MNSITYQNELRELLHHRVFHITVLGGLLMVLFGPLDYIIIPEHFQEFLGYRLVAVLISIVLLVVNYFDRQKKYAASIGMAEYLVISFILLLMIFRMDGGSSPYYVGLIVVMTVYSTLAPVTEKQSIFSGLFIVCCYALTIKLSGSGELGFSKEVFANLFFMICFVFIIATQSWTETRARKKEFQLRQQELEVNEELGRHIAILEEEVKKRTLQKAATEERYRLLFDQIADDVVVLNPKGEIFRTNKSFAKHYLAKHTNESTSFFNIVSPDDQQTLINLFNNSMMSGKALRSRSLQLIQPNGTICETEINISKISRNDECLGALLVIRDISTRKHLERRLFKSLKLKEQTENAAIMSLAKLSEYRDITPRNHLERIREYCRVLAQQLAWHEDFKSVISPDFIHDIYHAAILHDIGKVSLPDTLINKSTPLTEEEKAKVRRHTLIGGDVISQVEGAGTERSFLSMAKDIAYYHHERWDGKGYPFGLKEEEIPLAARIMAVADAYEGLTTSGEEQDKGSHERATEAIMKGINFQFDSRVAEALFVRQEEFKFIRERFAPAED